ncbi:MAG: tetratricopeptide repeat protein [Pirellulaceae bacterium]|nr:tetratricopeptide repeat protein [Pirellulaceae bacterium]
MPKSIAQSILQHFFRPRTAGLMWTGLVCASPLVPIDWLSAPTAWAVAEVQADSVAELAAAQQMLQAGQDAQALTALQKLRASDPNFAVQNDVDYLIVISGLRSGNLQAAWDAGQAWRAAQPPSLFQIATGAGSNDSTWVTRREMAAEVFSAQIRAGYQLALSAADLKGQQQWLAQAENVCRELRSLQPSTAYVEPLDYYTNLIALQQELQRLAVDPAPGNTVERSARLQKLADEFRAAADRATKGEWKHKNQYYAAVAGEMAGDVITPITLWDNLQKDTTVDAEIRRLSLSASAELHLGRWFAAAPTTTLSESEQKIRQQALLDAKARYEQLQSEFPEFDAPLIALNLGTCYRLLEDHPRAIAQFQRIVWPTLPESELGSAALAWQARFNQARSHLALNQLNEAREALDFALPRLNYATEKMGAEAILLRMRLAEQGADWPMVLSLRQQGDAWLKLIPEQQPEIDYLAALAQFQSTDQNAKSDGATLLSAIALQSSQPWADLAKLQLLPWQVEPTTTRQTSSRISFDQATPEAKERWKKAVEVADELLSSSLLKTEGLPVNPALLLPEHLEVLERRRQVRQWQANAFLRLGDYAQVAAKFGDLLKDYPNDAATAEWSMKRVVGLAKASSPAVALEQLTEALVQSWANETQAEGWWLRGELLRLNSDDVGASQAYEKSLGLTTDAETKLTALESALGALHRLSRQSDMVRLIDKWEPEFAGATRISLLLQRGIAQFTLKNYSQAEADFARLLSLASSTTPIDATERSYIEKLVADAEINQGWALHENGKKAEAKQLWELFLAKHSAHEHREQVIDWLKAIDPQWQAPAASGEVAETSGTSKTLEQRFEAAHQAFEKQQWAQASADFQRLADEAKDDSRHDQFLYYLGWSLREQDKLAEAKVAWEQMLSLHLNSPWVARCQFHLGEVDYREGNFARAAERFQSAKTVATEATLRRSAMYMEAWSDMQRNEFDLAKQKFQAIIDAAKADERELPLVLEAFALVGQCEYQAGKKSEALQTYQAAIGPIEKLKSQKPDMYFQVCFNAGRAAIDVDKPTEALQWLTKCLASIDGGQLPASIDESIQAEAKFLVGVARRLTKDLDGATAMLSTLSSRPDTVGIRSLLELALLARGRGDERAAQRHYTAVANGAYGDQLSAQAIEWKAQALLDMGLSLLRSANQQPDATVRAEYVRQAKTWLTRAQLQNDSTTVSQQATKQLDQLKQLGL